MTENDSRSHCSLCGDNDTEFVQYATGNESTTATTAEEVGDGLLELRWCDCGAAIENVLTVESRQVINVSLNDD
jgi:hypothetical protein